MSRTYHLFEAYGIEMEYMLVNRQTLDVMPICDKVIEEIGGQIENEISLGRINVSNELVMHVLEFKCNGPQSDLVQMQKDFQEQIRRVNKVLTKWDACLMPTAMHPWMNPERETRLWPHGQQEIYESYNRIFDCRGHGWSNLQSVHINLPFANDEEFGRLHAAIRLALPLLPGLAASSPLVEGQLSGKHDSRLGFYMQNQRRIPSIIGSVIPERVFTQKDYEEKILQNIYKDIAPQDPEEILQDEWLNSRGAIARFQRDAIEIRVLDIQECVAADFGVISLVVSLVKSLVDELWMSYEEQKTFDEVELRKIFQESSEEGLDYQIKHPAFLLIFGFNSFTTVRKVWARILDKTRESYPVKDFQESAERLIKDGDLAGRLLAHLGEQPSRDAIKAEYQKLVNCLEQGQFYA